VSIADELQKLERLRREGSLTDEEFCQARALILEGVESPTGEQAIQHLSHQLTEARSDRERAGLDLEWEIEREKHYLTTDRQGSRVLPSTRNSINFMIAGGIFGLISGLMVALVFVLSVFVNPVFWALFGTAAILLTFIGIFQYPRARRYEDALASYQARRQAILDESDEEMPPAAFLTDAAATNGHQVVRLLQDQLAEVRYQGELVRLDREWEIERQKHFITIGRSGGRELPSTRNGILHALFGSILGLTMTILAIPSNFPFVGLIFLGGAMGSGVYQYCRARAYQKALLAYQSRRAAIHPEQFR
jgi:hypothetical protein